MSTLHLPTCHYMIATQLTLFASDFILPTTAFFPAYSDIDDGTDSDGLTDHPRLPESVALVATAFRLIHRRQRKQFHWDDIFALIAGCFDTIVFACFWTRLILNDRARAGHPTSRALGVAIHLIMSLTFTSTLWSVRISIICSVLRIMPRGRTQILLRCIISAFALTWVLLIFFKCWICGSNMNWVGDCVLGRPFGIGRLTAVVVSNVILVGLPTFLLWHTSLPRPLRLMLRAIFSTSLLTTGISALHSVYAMGDNKYLEGFTAHFESAVTLMVCNLLVLVTFIYRRIRNGRDLDDELTEYLSTAPPRDNRRLTTRISFTNISSRSQPTFLSTLRRGSSVFLEANSSANAPGNDSCLESSLSSGCTSKESSVTKAL
ncbi:hypothetical protein D9615_004858 [Tricholomella constricta]|uniref:Rhodopsin domain-containing protein n=1 Tax=Tricholomella constricta TaxID=117010 RepID=A0A8H5HGW5_9AGAR|nr:hypothetical protein D9615_004858 [Tricholomella constricta]